MRLRRPLAIALLALLSLAALPRLERPAQASPRVSGRITANEVRHASPAEHGSLATVGGGGDGPGSGQTGGATVVLTSAVVDAGQRFDFVGVHWQGPETLPLEVRTSVEGESWSEWATLHEEEDMADRTAHEHYAAPHFASDARYAQYRLYFTDGDQSAARSVALTFMDVSDLNAPPLSRLLDDLEGAWRDFGRSWSAAAATSAIAIRTRQDWRADESLMQWTPAYAPWKKAVVHHTVTSNTYTDATAEIRAIYYYHAVTRGWGDIGYNFVVDRAGVIWTGRQGGDDVVAGHAYGWNEGSLGVAALGDFSVVPPSSATLSAFAHLIAMKFAQRGIQPAAADAFTHKEEDAVGNWVPITSSPPNVLGHRDCSYVIGTSGGQTSCPGGALYGYLPTIRSLAQQAQSDGYTYLVSYDTGLPRFATVGQTLVFPVTIKNVGRTTITAGGAAPMRLSYRVLNLATGAVVVSQGPLVALSGDIAPGASRTVTVSLAVPGAARYLVRWDLYVGSLGWLSSLYGAPYREQYLAAIEWDTTWIGDTLPTQLSVGQTVAANVTVKNTGGRVWPAANVRLSYHWVSDVTGRMVVWNGNRGYLPSDVQPGQQVTIPISVTTPTYPTRYRIQFDLVWDGAFWFGDRGVEPLEKIVNIPFDFRAAYTVPATLVLVPGQRTTAAVSVRNNGGATWQASGVPMVDLGTHWYSSTGALVEWDGPRTALPKNVGPGESATLQANVEAPAANGAYQLRFDLALEGLSWFSDKGTPAGVTSVTVRPPTYGARYAPQPVGAIAASVQTVVAMAVTNTSDFTWTSPAFALAYHVYDPNGALVTWDGLRTPLGASVEVGQQVTLRARLSLPGVPGSYTVKWDMVHEGVTWFSGKGVAPAVQVVTIGTASYDADYDVSLVPPTLPAGRLARVPVSVANASNFAFAPYTNTYLSHHVFDPAGRLVAWDGPRTPLDLVPGQSATVLASVALPAVPGTYQLRFDVVQEGVTWFSGRDVITGKRVVTAGPVERWASYDVGGDRSAAPGALVSAPITLTNLGTRTWSSDTTYLAYHLYRDGAVVEWDGLRTPLPGAVGPGGGATIAARVRAPSTAGTYEVRFDLVEEGITWFSGQGVPYASVALSAR